MLKWISALASSVFLLLGWGDNGAYVFLLFFFLCPLLTAEHYLVSSKPIKYLLGFFFFICFHLLAGFNLINDFEPWMVIFLLILNATALSTSWLAYITFKKEGNLFFSLLLLFATWMCLEQAAVKIGIPSPWFTLGNSLFGHPEFIQFYEYSGVAGGSLWILLSNFSIFYAIQTFKIRSALVGQIAIGAFVVIVFVLPILFSSQITFNSLAQPEEVLILSTRQSDGDILKLTFNQMIEESVNRITPKTKYIIWPENIFPSTIQLDQIEKSRLLSDVRKHLLFDSSTVFICGLIVSDKKEFFNAALIVDSKNVRLYKKRALVPFAEYSPPFLGSFKMFKWSDFEMSKGIDSMTEPHAMAVNICYESLFGDIVAENCLKSNAGALAIISNEFWTQGASEFLLGICSIRAIENRKFVLRSTNNGIPSVIEPSGKLSRFTQSEQSIIAIKANIVPNDYKTFYMRNGDLVGRLAIILLAVLHPLLLWRMRKQR